MHYFNTLTSALIALLLAGCQYISHDNDNGADEFFDRAEPVSFETIERGSNGSYDIEPQNMIIKDEETFRNFWKELYDNRQPLPSVPQVDFTKDMIVVTVMGTRPSGGYVAEITEAGLGFDRLGIRIKKRSPGEGCGVTGALTNPYHIAKMKRSSLEAQFFEEEGSVDCTE